MAKKNGFGTRAMRYPTRATAAWMAAVATEDTITATETRRKSRQQAPRLPRPKGITSSNQSTSCGPSTRKKKKAISIITSWITTPQVAAEDTAHGRGGAATLLLGDVLEVALALGKLGHDLLRERAQGTGRSLTRPCTPSLRRVVRT